MDHTRHTRMRTKLNLLLALALAAAACTSPAGDTTTTTTEASTTTRPPTTTQPSTTTTEAIALVANTTFHLADSGGHARRTGPFLIAVHDPGPDLGDPADNALAALVDGPPAAAEADGIGSEVPLGTSVVGIDAGSDGVATVELSSSFDDGGGSFSMLARLAQLTYTLTALDGVNSVLLMENGSVVEVFSNEGIVLDGPMVRGDFEDLLPGILVEEPAWGAPISLPTSVSGTAAAFEAVFQAQLLFGDEILFDPPFVMSSNGVGFGSFEFEVDGAVLPPADIQLRVWEFSAEDGSVINERFVPWVVAATG